jgi:dipeptidyl aminopeptidase/acylaminoacyl peptidase
VRTWRGVWSVVAFLGAVSLGPIALGACDPGVRRGAPTGSPSATRPPILTKSQSPAPHPVSIPALIAEKFDGRSLSVGRVIGRTDMFTRYFVTYRSGRFRISGTMHVPTGNGPFPVLVLAHGYRDPRTYVNGEGLRREQDYLAQRGYVVFHVDYRNHAQSNDDPNYELHLRLGYTEDVINAVLAIKRARLPYVDGTRVGLLGRSMGGGVLLNVAVVRPDLVSAIVLFDPVSSNTVDNFNKWTRTRPSVATRIVAAYGSPGEAPRFWRNVSPRNFFTRVQTPILIHHGTADTTTPLIWTRRTVTALEAARKEVTLLTYRGEPHVFGAAWPRAMTRTAEFFDRYLKA